MDYTKGVTFLFGIFDEISFSEIPKNIPLEKGLTIKTTKLLKPKHHCVGGANNFLVYHFELVLRSLIVKVESNDDIK